MATRKYSPGQIDKIVTRLHTTSGGGGGGGGGGGSGTVTTVSVASANGFNGTVAGATTTPVITIETTVTGLLKGNGTGVVAAVGDTDFQKPISLTTTGSSGAATFSTDTLNIPEYQQALTLTTTGSSGAATLSAGTLNIPQYTGGGGSYTGPTVVQFAHVSSAGITAVTMGSSPTNGNMLVAMCYSVNTPSVASGWTSVISNSPGTNYMTIAYRVASSDTTTETPFTVTGSSKALICVWEVNGQNTTPATALITWAALYYEGAGSYPFPFTPPVYLPTTQLMLGVIGTDSDWLSYFSAQHVDLTLTSGSGNLGGAGHFYGTGNIANFSGFVETDQAVASKYGFIVIST